jgi:hypothetical protein
VSRALLNYLCTDDDGNILVGAPVYVFQAETGNETGPTGTAITMTMYTTRSGSTVLAAPVISDAFGFITAWVADGANAVDLIVTDGGGTAHTADTPPVSLTFDPFLRTVNLIHPTDVFSNVAPAVQIMLDGSTYKALDYRTGRFVQSLGSSVDAATVIQAALVAGYPTAIVGSPQVRSSIVVPANATLIGLGSSWTDTAKPTLQAAAGWTGGATPILDVRQEGVTLHNLAVDAADVGGTQRASNALKVGSAGIARAYDCSFADGTAWGLETNGADCEFYNTNARNRVGGNGAFYHHTSSDLIYVGGRWSGGQTGANSGDASDHPTARIEGGNGHVISGIHSTCQNGKGNVVLGSDETAIGTLYVDNQGDVDGAAQLLITGGVAGANSIASLHIRGGNGTGANCIAIQQAGGGTTVISAVTVHRVGAGPQHAVAANVTGAGSTLIIESGDFDGIAASGLAAFTADTQGNFPILGRVRVNGALVDFSAAVTAITTVASSSALVLATSMTVPALSLQVGTTYLMEVRGRLTNTSGGAVQYQSKLAFGGATLASSVATSIADGTTNTAFVARGTFICQSPGPTGTAMAQCDMGINTVAGPKASNATAVSTVATGVDNVLGLGIQMDTSNANAKFIVDTAVIYRVKT